MKVEALERKIAIIELYNHVMQKRIVEPVHYKQLLTIKIYRKLYKESISIKQLQYIVYSDVKLFDLKKQLQKEVDLCDLIKSQGYSIRKLAKLTGEKNYKIWSRL